MSQIQDWRFITVWYPEYARKQIGVGPPGSNLPQGGTSGQVLAKTSYEDYQTDWQNAGGPPSGPAGGVLSGTYPNPGFAVDMATQSELDAVDIVVLNHSTRHENGGADEIDVTGLSGLLATSQTPATHATSHQNGGSDELNLVGLSGLLGDPQTPLTHNIITAHNGFPGGTTTFLRADGTFAVPPDTDTGITQLTGDVTAGPGSGSQAATIPDGTVTFAKMQNIATTTLLGRTTAGTGDPEMITVGPALALSGGVLGRAALTGDVTAALDSNTTTIANDAVTNAKLANVPTATFKGRTTAATGDPEDLTVVQATALLDLFTSTLKGLVPLSGGGTANFLRADGSWSSPTAAPTPFTAFTRDLGTARRSGTFDLTGLSGLTADKVVSIIQSAAAITSKGNARDEPEMDQIKLTGYVVDATTIRAYWWAPAVVVGTYAFAYLVSG